MQFAHSLQIRTSSVVEADSRCGEVCEFVAGDDPPAQANPVFKERLRGQLWQMLCEGRKRQR